MSEGPEMRPEGWDDLSLWEQISLLPEAEQEEAIRDLIRRGIDLDSYAVLLRPKQKSILESDEPVILYQAGRGTGKTFCGSAWVNTYAKNHPGCRIALVGRTVADVRDTMVLGDSGIINTAPKDFVPIYTPSIRHLEWPNGSTGTTYAAVVPDLMRGPQQDAAWCLVAGTQVTTPKGNVAIESLTVGDWVSTPDGNQRITATGRREADLWSVNLASGDVLCGSAEHPIATNRGWVALSQVRSSDILFTWNDEEAQTVDFYGNTTGMLEPTDTLSSTLMAKCTCNIESSMKNTMGSHSQGKTLSTTSTVTRLTTESRTLNCTIGTPISHNMQRSGSRSCARCVDHSGTSRYSDPSGCTAKLAFLPQRSIESPWKEPASIAARPFSAREFAQVARLSTIAVEGAATRVGLSAYVYNITVEKSHKFFANGVLTHNCDELAAYPTTPDSSGATMWDNIVMATRLGDNPQILATTTPKRVPLMYKLKEMADNGQGVKIVTGTSWENRANLSKQYMDQVFAKYAGTYLERQELYGELIGDSEDALWNSTMIEYDDMPEDEELLIVIGVDPAVTVGNDDTGIVVVASDLNPDPYKRRAWVVDDYTMNDHVEKWAEVVLDVQRKWSMTSSINPRGRPAMVVVEKDHGHDLLGVLFKNAGADLNTTPIIPISTRGMSKTQRAESVVLAYQQGRVKHDKKLPGLETEMTGWEPRNTKGVSPGHIDALVHALRTLLVDTRPIARWAPMITSDDVDYSRQTLAGVTPAWKRDRGIKTGLGVAPWRARR